MSHPAEKGHPKWGGRQKGTTNKVKQIGRETVIEIASNIKNGILDDFARLEPRDRVRFFIELMKFVVPQRQETVIESRSYNEQLRALCDEYESGASPEEG